MTASPVHTHCTYAPSGTYGHECGAVATLTAIKNSTKTSTGLYYAARCVRCAGLQLGENSGVRFFEPRNPEKHVNQWI
jgi:hypothetical protein